MRWFKRRRILKELNRLLEEEAIKQSKKPNPDYHKWVTIALRICKVKGR